MLLLGCRANLTKVMAVMQVPYTGIGQFVALFPEPGDPDYEPEPENKIEGPRVFRNPEMPTQAQCNAETRAEK